MRKSTQFTEHNYLSHKEKAKIEQDRKELGWFIQGIAYMHKPNYPITHYIKEIIQARLCVREGGWGDGGAHVGATQDPILLLHQLHRQLRES